jgi:hypothetical protein
MFEFLEEVIVAFDKADPKGGGTKTSAAPSDLFKIDEDCHKLSPKKSKSSTILWRRCFTPPSE